MHETSEEPAISIDILSTICDALDISLPENRIYDGNDNTWAVREGKWKLISSKKLLI